VIAGVHWVPSETADKGVATVANMSLGGSGSKDGTCNADGFTGSDAFHEAVCNAAHEGVVFAVAAGNDGADAENSVPAAYDDAVMTTSATEEGDDWPSWSNWGDEDADWTWDGVESAPVALAAPGVDILSTQAGGGTTTLSGTSMASPHLAGSAAGYLDANSLSNDYSAFTDTRAGLLGGAEDTEAFSNTSGNPHDEPFVAAP
jgi:subtilisin